MVVRREEKGLRRYCHLGAPATTLHQDRTACIPTMDFLTVDESIGEDIREIFLQLTGAHSGSEVGGGCCTRPSA